MNNTGNHLAMRTQYPQAPRWNEMPMFDFNSTLYLACLQITILFHIESHIIAFDHISVKPLYQQSILVDKHLVVIIFASHYINIP